MRRAPASTGLLLLALAVAACRQATGLDSFVVQCVPGEPGCLDSEDCVTGVDANGDGVVPPECSGDVEWLRVTPGTGTQYCPQGEFGNQEIQPRRALSAMASFGDWTGAAGSLRGSLGDCESLCTFEAHGLDSAGDDLAFAPALPCDDSGLLQVLARGRDRAYAVAAIEPPEELPGPRRVVLSAHRLTDASFASSWEWQPPGTVVSLALAADTSAVIAVGQSSGVIFAEPDDALPRASFHQLAGGRVSSIALTRAAGARTLLLAGQTVSPENDPGPCGLGAVSPTAFIAKVPLGQGSTDSAAPTPITCAGFPLQLDLGTETKGPSMKVAAGAGGRACWAYLGTDAVTNQRRLRVGCLDAGTSAAGWKQEAVLGDHLGEDADIALDPFGHVLVTAALNPLMPPLPLWGGAAVAPAAPGTPNILLLKLHRDTGAVIWARMFAAVGGNARHPHVAVDDDAAVRLGIVTDGPALTGDGLEGVAGASGLAVHFLGLRP